MAKKTSTGITLVSVSDEFKAGYDAGKETGWVDGYKDGNDAGFARGYDAGYSDGVNSVFASPE